MRVGTAQSVHRVTLTRWARESALVIESTVVRPFGVPRSTPNQGTSSVAAGRTETRQSPPSGQAGPAADVFAGVAHAVAVVVELGRVGAGRAVVAGVAEAVEVGVGLVGVRRPRAVVVEVGAFADVVAAGRDRIHRREAAAGWGRRRRGGVPPPPGGGGSPPPAGGGGGGGVPGSPGRRSRSRRRCR